MTKYLEYTYTDDDGTVHHVKDAKEEKSGWEKSFYIRPWIVFVLIVLVIVGGCSALANKADQDQTQRERYSQCLMDEFPNGNPARCDYLRP